MRNTFTTKVWKLYIILENEENFNYASYQNFVRNLFPLCM